MMDGELAHLSAATRVIVDRPGPERLALLHGQWWINHSRARAALDKLEAVLAYGPGRIRPPNLLIVGPTNNGKSMVAEKFRRLHPATPSACGGHEIVPVVVMQMPAEPSLRRFYAALLMALNAPVSFNVPGARLEGQALTLLRAVEARVLVIDELHNVLAGSHARRAEFLNTLRFLGNELRIPIVGVGTKQAQIAVRSDDQLENRFEPVPLPAWQDDLEFARLLTSFESALPLRMPSGLGASPELRSLILRRSTGLIGEVASFLTSAAAHALARGHEQIDRAMLEQCDYCGPDERRALFEASFPRVR